jgi:hypothetical protein
VPRALIVTITEGIEFQPQAAFLSSALKALGFETKLLQTDFCTTQDSFQTAVREAKPDAVLFMDALEWREILATLSGFAVNTTSGPVVVVTALDVISKPGGFEERVEFVADGEPSVLAAALGVDAERVRVATLPLDYGLYGGPDFVRRGMGCSLFGDVGTVALLASRPVLGGAFCPTAALLRLEAPVPDSINRTLVLEEWAALTPLEILKGHVRAVEWWEPEVLPRHAARVKQVLGCPQTCRLATCNPSHEEADDLRRDGVTRVVYDCDVLDDAAALPWDVAAPASTVAGAAVFAKQHGLEVGVLLVIGLPGETALHTKARCDLLRKAGIDRVRVIPFEPAGGTPAYDWCIERGLWPPKENRWNRELYQPLEQPQKPEWPRILEEALMLVADVEARAGAPA